MSGPMRFATLLAFTLIAAACDAKKSQSAADLLGQARRLERDGQEDAAIAAYRRAVNVDRTSFDAHYGLARTLDLAGQYDEARQHFATAISLAPEGTKDQALRMMGIAWVFVGNRDEAMRYFREVFDRRVASGNLAGAAEEANELGRVSLELNQVDDAETWYQKGHELAGREADRPASEVDLADMRWAHAQARVAARRGREREARVAVAEVKRLLDKGGNEDQRVQYAYLRGYVDFYLSHYSAAIPELERADQQDPFILFLLGEAREKVGQPDLARTYYTKVLASTSHAVNSAFVRAAAREKLAQAR
jgi:tetratricopeptide (TPR) repeat protein